MPEKNTKAERQLLTIRVIKYGGVITFFSSWIAMLITGLLALQIDPKMQTASKWITAWPWITLLFAAVAIFAHKEEERITEREKQDQTESREAD